MPASSVDDTSSKFRWKQWHQPVNDGNLLECCRSRDVVCYHSFYWYELKISISSQVVTLLPHHAIEKKIELSLVQITGSMWCVPVLCNQFCCNFPHLNSMASSTWYHACHSSGHCNQSLVVIARQRHLCCQFCPNLVRWNYRHARFPKLNLFETIWVQFSWRSSTRIHFFK